MPIIFYTNFETGTTWWDPNPGANQWENDPGEGPIRTTDWTGAAPAPAITSGRSGTGTAVWMGTHSLEPDRSELFRDRVIHTYEPTYVGYSIWIDERLPSSRAYSQMRNMKQASDPVNTNAAKNPYMLRQHSNSEKAYFQLLTDPAVAEVFPDPSGASEGAETWPKDGNGFDLPSNQWNDIVIYWDALNYTNDNTLKIWVNGVLIVDHFGVTNRRYMPENTLGQYLEVSGDLKHNIGTYWATAGKQGNAYFDEYKVCEGIECTYEMASPLGLSPGGIDTTAPSVTQITVSNILDDIFKVSWNLDEASKGSIEYGTSTGVYTNNTPLRNQFSTSFVEEVGATIPLQSNTTYYWRIRTEDVTGNIGYSTEQNTTTISQLLRNNKPVGFGAGPIVKAYIGAINVIK